MLGERTELRLTFAQLRHELVVLFKLRVISLLLAAAAAGAFLTARGFPGWSELGVLLLGGLSSAAGASALNEWLERDQDALMNRTRTRPLVSGILGDVSWVPWVGAAMVVAPSLLLLPFNPALALFLFLGAFIYVVIYTLWLKPRTTLNIVIGGAAGSCAVLSGSAAAGNWADPGALLLAALVFLWTPIHFWSLALVYREDYARAGVPMLPVRATPRRAAFWGLVHGLGAGACSLALVPASGLSLVYAIPAGVATVALWALGIGLVLDPSKRRAWRLFHASNFYLLIILVAAFAATLA